MLWTLMECVGIAFACMALFFLWGRGFLTFIKAERDFASCVAFGYMCFQTLYQVVYLPFYFSRGSYRILSYTWLSLALIISILLLAYTGKHKVKKKISFTGIEKAGICIAGIIIFGLSIFICLHVPFYGLDTITYIGAMNESLYRDAIWVESGKLSFHFGMCSFFHMFTTPSLISGIKPYYISLFTVRVVGIFMSSLILYRIGNTVFKKDGQRFSWMALALTLITPIFIMFWGSAYTAEFYYWRINEAKGYCQFVLLPLSFSVFLAMLRKGMDRKGLWREQLLVAFSSVSVSASSLTPYLFLLFMGTSAILAYDKLRNGWKTIGHSTACAIPNILYLIIYIFEKAGYVVL